MGGSIQTSFRLENGTIITDSRWTNPLPTFARDVRFIEGDHEYFKEFATRESSYRGKFFLAPEQYGLVVFDFMTKTILIYAIDYIIYDRTVPSSIYWDCQNNETANSWEKLVQQGRVKIQVHEYKRGSYHTNPLSTKEIPFARDINLFPNIGEQFRSFCRIEDYNVGTNDHCLYVEVKIDNSPWTIIRYDETGPNAREHASQMQAKLKELGWEMTDNDQSKWEEWFKYHEVDMTEDGD